MIVHLIKVQIMVKFYEEFESEVREISDEMKHVVLCRNAYQGGITNNK